MRRKKKIPEYSLDTLPRALERRVDGAWPKDGSRMSPRPQKEPAKAGHLWPVFPGKPRLGLNGGLILAELPPDINRWRGKREPIASWQEGLRRVFEHYFRRGYAAVDFLSGERCFYVLRKDISGPHDRPRGMRHRGDDRIYTLLPDRK